MKIKLTNYKKINLYKINLCKIIKNNELIPKKIIKKNELILKSRIRFRSKKHNVFPEKLNKIALSADDGKWIQSIDSIETYPHGTNEEIIHKKEKLKCINIIKHFKTCLTIMMLQKIYIKKHNPNWP